MMNKIHVVLATGTVVNIDMPPEFDFATWIRAIRSDGFVMGPKLYISLGAIAAVFMLDPEQGVEIKPPGATIQ